MDFLSCIPLLGAWLLYFASHQSCMLKTLRVPIDIFMDSEDRILYLNDWGGGGLVTPEASSLLKTFVHLSEISCALVSFFNAI